MKSEPVSLSFGQEYPVEERDQLIRDLRDRRAVLYTSEGTVCTEAVTGNLVLRRHSLDEPQDGVLVMHDILIGARTQVGPNRAQRRAAARRRK